MIRLLFLALFLYAVPFDAEARVLKVGDPSSQRHQPTLERKSGAGVEISCFEDDDCSDAQECVALRCESVCKNSICSSKKHCIPAGQEKPHSFKCVECAVDYHCSDGFFCNSEHVCEKKNPCLKAVCSPAAPFCMPKPYKTLPYTCVQCLENEHCPPVAGLTRSCIDGYCLFNVEGNIPEKKK